MPPDNTLLAGPRPQTLREQARTIADSVAGEHPGSVLYLTQSRTAVAELQRQWRAEYSQLRLTCSTLDEYVGELFETATDTLATTRLTRPERFRLAEAALERYTPDHSTALSDITAPSTALVDQVQGLFSLLEYAGYDSPERIEQALHAAGATATPSSPAPLYGAFRDADSLDADSTLAEQAAVFSELRALYTALHDEIHPEWMHTVAEQYLHLLDTDQLAGAVPDTVDVIILDGLTRLAPAERAAVARLAAAYPTIAVVPLAHQSLDGTGTDAGVQRALDFYTGAGFTPEYLTDTPAPAARVDAVQELYTQGEPATQIDGAAADLTLLNPATERAEVRTVARRIQALLTADTDPADIGVIVTDRARYRGILAETFTTYEIPFTFTNEIGLEQTLVGDAVEALLDLAAPDEAGTAVRRLVSNPLVDLTPLGIDAQAVATAATQTTTDTLTELSEQLQTADATATATAVETLCARVTPATQSLSEFVTAIQTLIDEIELEAAVTAYGQGPTPTGSHRPAYEQSAIRAVTRVLESFEETSQFLSNTEPATRLRRAFRAELVGGPRQQPGYVRVQPIAEAEMAAFEHVFVIGLTLQSFPSEGETMAFFDSINDAAEEFSRENTGRRAQYIFGTLLTGSAHVTLSHPRHTIDGTDQVPAPIVTELTQYVDLSPETGVGAAPRVTSEDVQDAYARWGAGMAFESPRPAVAPLQSATGLSTTARTFGTNGVHCSWHRSRGGLSEYDAQLPDVIDTIYPPDDREPYSPTALEDYARCPFVFLLDRVLGFEDEYADDAEITRGDRGIYIHETLATFYRTLREECGTPVDLTAHDRAPLERRLLDAAHTERSIVGDATTPFSERVLGRLLSGLATPAANDYYGYRGGADGLFVRLLDTELDLQQDVDTHPRYFEGTIGLGWLDGDQFTETPATVSVGDDTVTIRGIVDRVDLTNTSPRELHIRDYKTGSIPAGTDVTLGTKLQLPLYGYAVEDALTRTEATTHETIAGSYYGLGNPDSIDPTSTLITADESIDTVAPGGTGQFATRAELRTFITEVTPTRVNRITTGIANGGFHPTLLSANHAGCEDCTFRQACDVRHHHQRETIATIDHTEQYVSEQAAGTELELAQYTTGGDD